jgi:hypothetical protein
MLCGVALPALGTLEGKDSLAVLAPVSRKTSGGGNRPSMES